MYCTVDSRDFQDTRNVGNTEMQQDGATPALAQSHPMLLKLELSFKKKAQILLSVFSVEVPYQKHPRMQQKELALKKKENFKRPTKKKYCSFFLQNTCTKILRIVAFLHFFPSISPLTKELSYYYSKI